MRWLFRCRDVIAVEKVEAMRKRLLQGRPELWVILALPPAKKSEEGRDRQCGNSILPRHIVFCLIAALSDTLVYVFHHVGRTASQSQGRVAGL